MKSTDPSSMTPRQITRLLTKVAFQAAEIEDLKKQRKTLNQKAAARHENAKKKSACANCEKNGEPTQAVADGNQDEAVNQPRATQVVSRGLLMTHEKPTYALECETPRQLP